MERHAQYFHADKGLPTSSLQQPPLCWGKILFNQKWIKVFNFVCIFQWFDNVGAEEVTVLSTVFHKRELQIRKSKLSKLSQGGHQFFYWIEIPMFPQSQSVSSWNYRVCVCKPPGCSILDMNPPSNNWAAINAQHTPAGKVTGILLLSFGPTFLCLQTLSFLTPGAVSVSIYVLKSYLIISLWVPSHYKAYLCLITLSWHLFLLKFPSLLLYPVCTLGKGKDFSFKWQFCNSCDCPLGFTPITASWAWNHAAETWGLPHERILDDVAFTCLFLH